MPIVSTVNHERREIHSIAIGPVTFADVKEHLERERKWGGLPYPELIDGRGAGPDFSSDEVRRIVALLRKLGEQSSLGRTAVLVSTDYAFGVVRMIETLLDDVCEVKPFRDEREARAWLGERGSPAASA